MEHCSPFFCVSYTAMMRPFAIAAALVVAGAPVLAGGADVIVLDPDGRPVPKTAVLCTDGGNEMRLTARACEVPTFPALRSWKRVS
jgi:hypothetical protein